MLVHTHICTHPPPPPHSHSHSQPMAAEVWTTFAFHMTFTGVQLEFLQQRETDIPGSTELSLALFDIQDSMFSFLSHSDQTRSVDFTNHVVIGYDSRYTGEDMGFL